VTGRGTVNLKPAKTNRRKTTTPKRSTATTAARQRSPSVVNLQQQPDARTRQLTKAKVFVSYSRKDIQFADRLETALKARGFEPLIDRTERVRGVVEANRGSDWFRRHRCLCAQS
jgi:hypothetical protein